MGNSLSKDLRDRALATYDRGGRSIASVARQLGIAPQTLGAWLRRRRETGSAEPLPHAGGRSHAKIQPVHERALETYIEADCSMTLPEMAARLSADHQLTIDPSQLSRVLARLGYTRKKKSWVDPRVDRPDIAVRRAVWAAMATLLRLGAPHIVHVDESGFDLAMAPAYGRSKRGARCRARRKRRTQRFTLIAACGLTGWRAARLIRGGMDRDSWVAWVREQLAPRLAPGTIVLLDNLKIHYDAEGLALLEEAGGVGALPAAVLARGEPDRGGVLEGEVVGAPLHAARDGGAARGGQRGAEPGNRIGLPLLLRALQRNHSDMVLMTLYESIGYSCCTSYSVAFTASYGGYIPPGLQREHKESFQDRYISLYMSSLTERQTLLHETILRIRNTKTSHLDLKDISTNIIPQGMIVGGRFQPYNSRGLDPSKNDRRSFSVVFNRMVSASRYSKM